MGEMKRLFDVLISLGETSKAAADDAAKEGDSGAEEFFDGERSAYRHIALIVISKIDNSDERDKAERLFEETM